jgi:hydrophobe/amphiphile efflux-1 (HAE1) family protein
MRIEFQPSINLDVAANDVREAVNRVQRELPEDIENLFVVKADDDAQAIVEVAAFSNTLSKEELAKRIEKDVAPNLQTIPGVAEVRLNGNQQRVLRVLLDPARLAGLSVSVPEVIETLRGARLDVPAGSYESTDTELIIRAYASVLKPERIEQLYVRDRIRIADVGVAFYGPEDPESYSLLNGREVIGLEVVRQAGSNTIAIANAVNERISELNNRNKNFQLYVISDASIFIKGALSEVVYSLLIAVLIVLVVIAVFLGDLRATIIPAVTMPVSLIGTLAAIWLFGFSINLLTLLALVLATGLIVDDAIVVLENIQRHNAMGIKRMASAVLGTEQVYFAVIATTATLVSVFLPIAFLPSQTGRLFREFGMVLAVAVCISSVVALTLCPMLSSKLADRDHREGTGSLMRLRSYFEDIGLRLTTWYFNSLEIACFRRPFVSLSVACLFAASGVWMLFGVDQELLPREDRGVLRVMVTGPDGATLSYADRQSVRVEEVLHPYQELGLIKDLSTIVGSYDPNRAFTTATLIPWDKRDVTQMQLIAEINDDLQAISGGEVRIRSENSLNLRGGGSGGLEIALVGNNYSDILRTANQLASELSTRIPEVESAIVQFDTSQSQLSFDIDREKANDLRVPLTDISQTLQVMVDRLDVVDLSIDDEAVPIMLGSLKGSINDPGDLLNIFIPNSEGKLIPLSALVKVKESGVAAELDRHEQRRAIEIDVGIAPGSSLGEVVERIRNVADEILPNDVGVLLLGEAATLDETTYEVGITFLIALLVVFLVLAAQFENVGSAIIVIFTVPFGLAAAVFALMLSGQTLNLYSQIGLVMLVGLMTKNAILLVEFMDQLRDEGRSVHDAIIEGVEVRLRPLAMTVISTVVGSLPLIISSGPGSEARAAIGWVVFGGLGLSSLFTLYLTPLGYSLLAPFVAPRSRAGDKLSAELEEASHSLNAAGT